MANIKTTFGKIFNKTYILGIVTVTSLGMLPLAALANPQTCCKAGGGDNAVIQTSNQNAHVSGSGNRVRQNASQSANSAIRRGSGNQGIVQEQSQYGDSNGHGNRVNQNVRQSNGGQSKPTASRRPARVHPPAIQPSNCNNTCAKKGI